MPAHVLDVQSLAEQPEPEQAAAGINLQESEIHDALHQATSEEKPLTVRLWVVPGGAPLSTIELGFCKLMNSCYKAGPLGHSKWLSVLARKHSFGRTVALG
jgi:hypothetical protein